MNKQLCIPGSVPRPLQETYKKNWQTLTANSGHIFFLAGDQKLEHLGIDIQDQSPLAESLYPSHMFRIASQGAIPLATHYGFVAQYGTQFPTVPYIIKMTGKTNALSTEVQDPYSAPLTTIEDIIMLQKNTGLTICGIGISIYIGSIYESTMLQYAAQTLIKAHQHGLITIVWLYARGKNITTANPITPHQLVCVGSSLGADFIKIVPSLYDNDEQTAHELRTITAYAEQTGIICAGGAYTTNIQMLLYKTSLYKNKGNVKGIAMGRNILLRPLPDALALCTALKAIIHKNIDPENAYELYKK